MVLAVAARPMKLSPKISRHASGRSALRLSSNLVSQGRFARRTLGDPSKFEKDPLTGCKTRGQLFEDIRRATTEGWQALYRSDFACLDIEDFKTYLDNTGPAGGDEVLKGIGKQLRETYSDANVYRFGGDEFVIELRGRPYSPAQTPAGISLKHSIVRVVAKKNQRRNHYVNRVIILHLDKGIIEATQEGD